MKPVMKAWSVIGLLFAAAILATIPKNGPGADMMGCGLCHGGKQLR